MASIQERGSAVRVLWRLGGSGPQQSCTFNGTAEARMKLAKAADALLKARSHALTRGEVYDAILGKEDADTSVPTFATWVDEYLADRARMRDVQPDVIHSYRRILKSRAVPYLGHLRLTDIDQDALRNWVAALSSARITIGSKHRRIGNRLLSSETIRRTHAILHTCLGAAVPRWLPHNPAARPAGSSKHVSGLPKKEQFEGMFLTPDEINTLLEHCDPHIRDLVFAAVGSGLRLGELVALECRHVVFDRDGTATILVRQALKNDGTVGPPKSKASHRDVTVDEVMSKMLAARVQGKRPRVAVFPSPRGGMWDEHNLRDRYWYRSVAAAMRCPEHPPPAPAKPTRGPRRGLRNDEVSTCDCPARLHRRPRFHDLRHTHASLLIADGWHIAKIQRRLGHSSYHTTVTVYAHLLDLGSKDELKRLQMRLQPRVIARHPVTVHSRAESARRRARGGGVRRRLSRR